MVLMVVLDKINIVGLNDINVLMDIIVSVKLIIVEECRVCIEKVQLLMKVQDIVVILIELGVVMEYFFGIKWWCSECLIVLIIFKKGDVVVIMLFFEKFSVFELLVIGDDVRVWQEYESLFDVVVSILKLCGIISGNIGFESSVCYFVVIGVSCVLLNMKIVFVEFVMFGCCMYKIVSELVFMYKVNEVILWVYEFVFNNLKFGMVQQDVKSLMNIVQQCLGGSGVWCLVFFNDVSVYFYGMSVV